MVSSVIPLSARTLDKQAATRPVDSRATPAFTREAVDASGKSDVKGPRSFGVQERPCPSTAGFVRQVPAKAENKDEAPGVLGDVAIQTKNSAGEFMGAIGRSAPSLQQVTNVAALTVHGLSGAGAGALTAEALGAISGYPLPAEAQGVLVGAGAVAGVVAGAAMKIMLPPALARMDPAAADHAVS